MSSTTVTVLELCSLMAAYAAVYLYYEIYVLDKGTDLSGPRLAENHFLMNRSAERYTAVIYQKTQTVYT